jgi:hypothetical protein
LLVLILGDGEGNMGTTHKRSGKDTILAEKQRTYIPLKGSSNAPEIDEIIAEADKILCKKPAAKQLVQEFKKSYATSYSVDKDLNIFSALCGAPRCRQYLHFRNSTVPRVIAHALSIISNPASYDPDLDLEPQVRSLTITGGGFPNDINKVRESFRSDYDPQHLAPGAIYEAIVQGYEAAKARKQSKFL